ncbi:MAG: hypothetical protein CSA62_06435 [Planctomycetota bacterium]|nr:MAG: hypothetical protein CSA62_06435 [Planctomycetota bacterium]
MQARYATLLLLSALLLVGCVSESTKVSPVRPIAVEELGRWRVERSGSLVGVLKKLRLQDRAKPDPFYLVEHASGQQAGMIDHLGRAYRTDPFSGERVLVGMGSMQEDLRLLLELSELPEILPWNKNKD